MSSKMTMSDKINAITLEFLAFSEHHRLNQYPNWMGRYFNALEDSEKWLYFLAYRHLTRQMVSETYLVDQLKWILKQPSMDLPYDLYIQIMFDLDVFVTELFKPDAFEALERKYAQRFRSEFPEYVLQPALPVSSDDAPMDTLPF